MGVFWCLSLGVGVSLVSSRPFGGFFGFVTFECMTVVTSWRIRDYDSGIYFLFFSFCISCLLGFLTLFFWFWFFYGAVSFLFVWWEWLRWGAYDGRRLEFILSLFFNSGCWDFLGWEMGFVDWADARKGLFDRDAGVVRRCNCRDTTTTLDMTAMVVIMSRARCFADSRFREGQTME